MIATTFSGASMLRHDIVRQQLMGAGSAHRDRQTPVAREARRPGVRHSEHDVHHALPSSRRRGDETGARGLVALDGQGSGVPPDNPMRESVTRPRFGRGVDISYPLHMQGRIDRA